MTSGQVMWITFFSDWLKGLTHGHMYLHLFSDLMRIMRMRIQNRKTNFGVSKPPIELA